MKQALTEFQFQTARQGFVEITRDIAGWVQDTGIAVGLLTLHCQHTSASLLITENASPAVLRDLRHWLDRVAPESAGYDHDEEGPDDMPAHLKSALTGVNLSIPVQNARMMLGTWQGIFLAEHRNSPHRRHVAAHLIGE